MAWNGQVLVYLAALFLLVRLSPQRIRRAGGGENSRAEVDNRHFLVWDPVHPREEVDGSVWTREAQEKLSRDINANRQESSQRHILPRGWHECLNSDCGQVMGSPPCYNLSRIHRGQKDPSLVGGEQAKLTFEQFPNLGMSQM
jgi:hypothetical protein